MLLQELIAGTTTPPAVGPQVLYRRYTRSGTEAWRFVRIPPTERDGKKVVFRCVEHTADPPRRLPIVNMLDSYVSDWEATILEEDRIAGDRLYKRNDPCRSILKPSSATSPQDREPPMRAEPAGPAPGPTTKSSRRRSSAQSGETMIEDQLKLEL